MHGLEAVGEAARLKRANAPGFEKMPWEKVYYQEGSIQFWYRRKIRPWRICRR
ncbi:MAG: hypothetical protein WDO73_00940 [Ignavibacteriota bacterium]